MQIRFFIFAIILLGAATVYARQILAVLEIIPQSESEINVSNAEMRHLTDELRRQAVLTLPREEYTVLTRDNILSLLPADEEERECIAESCAVEIGRALGTEYISQGTIGRFGELLTISIELYETISGRLLSSIVMESKDIMGLLIVIREKSPELFAAVKKHTPAPLPQPAPPPPLSPASSNPCHKEILDLSNSKKGFNAQNFITDLGVSVAKVQASCKTKFTCPADSKVMDVGLTAGCIKQLPTSPSEIKDLLESIGMDLTAVALTSISAEIPNANPASGKKTSTWIAIGLDVLGAAMIGFGIYKHIDAHNLYDDYNNMPDGLYAKNYDKALEKANDALTLRDIGYIVGGALLTTGIAVHIWF